MMQTGKPFAEGALRHAFNAEATGNITPVDDSQFPHSTELYSTPSLFFVLSL